MVNLIPQSAKKRVRFEYWARVVTVWSLIAGVVLLLLIVILLPVYVLVDAKITAYQSSAASAETENNQYRAVQEALNRTTSQAQFILASEANLSLYALVTLYDRLATNGITVTGVSVTKTSASQVAPVQLSGEARDRQSLADFRDRLLAEDSIEAVDFPISNLTRDRDIPFSVTVTMANNVSP